MWHSQNSFFVRSRAQIVLTNMVTNFEKERPRPEGYSVNRIDIFGYSVKG